MRISRGWTTVASAIAGFVMAIRMTSKSGVSTIERPVVSCRRGNASGCCGAAGACGGIGRLNTAQAIARTNRKATRGRTLIAAMSVDYLLGTLCGPNRLDPVYGWRRRNNGNNLWTYGDGTVRALFDDGLPTRTAHEDRHP